MRAFLIPANSSEPVRKIDFDHDESWRYVVTRYRPDDLPWLRGQVALLTKENAPGDYLLRNSRASEYIQDNLAAEDRSDDPDDHPKNLYGDVIVLGYDRALEKLTHVPSHVHLRDFEPFGTCPSESPQPPSPGGRGGSANQIGFHVDMPVGIRGRDLTPKEERELDAWLKRRRVEQNRNRGRDDPSPNRDNYQRGGAPDWG
jgi:hypothetical protein